VVLTGVYLVVISKRVNLKPRRITAVDEKLRERRGGTEGGGYWFHGPTLWLAFSVTGQSLFKHLLTEGDKLVLTFLTTPYTQGIYSVVSNYGTLLPWSLMFMHANSGSLIARILFQPMEETLRTIISRLLSTPSPPSLDQSSRLITTLIKLHVLLAIIIHVLVPPIIPSIILPILGTIIGADRFPPAALYSILYAYIYYIPIMAINGITESFISSVATTTDLARQSRAMVLFSLVFLGVSWGLLRAMGMGGEGLVWANCVNLGVRIMWSTRFITQWYGVREHNVRWKSVVPTAGTLLVAGVLSLGIRVVGMTGGLDGFVKSVGVVGTGGLGLVVCMYSPLSSDMINSRAYFEREFLRVAYSLISPKATGKKIS
jgi:oligosaccharide translocation protein RFT1